MPQWVKFWNLRSMNREILTEKVIFESGLELEGENWKEKLPQDNLRKNMTDQQMQRKTTKD